MSSRKFILKEISQPAATYVGRSGEVWFQEGTTAIRFGDDVTPGGLPLGGNGTISGPTLCAPGVDTVIYSASVSAFTVRLTAQARGYETGVVNYMDTHSADIMAVLITRPQLLDADVSVYGVTYTSVAPLVVFDARVTGEVIEITATPTSPTNFVTVTTIATEIAG